MTGKKDGAVGGREGFKPLILVIGSGGGLRFRKSKIIPIVFFFS